MSDLISRQAAIDALGEEPEVWAGSDDEVAARGQWRIDKAAIEAVPTAEKKGKWINGKCNQCGEHALFWAMSSGYCASNYCPNCGAKMEV